MKYILIEGVGWFCNLLYVLILVRVILSWFPMVHGSKPVRILFRLTEPILSPIRGVIQRSPLGGSGMVLDFSPIIAFFLLQLLQTVLVSLIAMI
jgi:YggT family protein